MDHDPIAAQLLKPYRFSDQTSLRFAIAPERVEEIFDPLDLASPDFAERMLEIGHSRDVRLFGYLYAKEAPRLEQTWLVIDIAHGLKQSGSWEIPKMRLLSRGCAP